VIVVEHDEDAIRAPTTSSTSGPGAGVHGGEIVAAGHAETSCATALAHRPVPLAAKRDRGAEARRASRQRDASSCSSSARAATT
jgi:excinuclease ABC subunit A